MTMVYHGTWVWNLKAIVRAGALLSPLDQEKAKIDERIGLWQSGAIRRQGMYSERELIKYLKRPDFDERRYQGLVTKLAYEEIKRRFQDRELVDRGMSVDVTPNFRTAASYADKNGDNTPGIVFGLELDDERVKSSRVFYNKICVPYRLTLDTLREVHFFPHSHSCREEVKELFVPYNPNYFEWDSNRPSREDQKDEDELAVSRMRKLLYGS